VLLVFIFIPLQLLSQEIDVNKLVEKAMEIIAEHAGADHGILMIREKDPSSDKHDVYAQLMVKAIWEVFPEKQPKTSEAMQECKAGHVAIHNTMPLNSSIIPGIKPLTFLFLFISF
jgi:hypothetical protein